MAGPIRIAILANAAQAVSELNKTAGAADDMGSRLGKAGKVVGTALAAGAAAAGVAVAGLAVASVKSASDAQQSLGATETVFGKYAGTVIKRSNEAATAIGLSANEYRELSNVTGASLAATGLPMEKVTKLTGDLNTRAADLAATFGGSTKEAIESVSSLLRGEADPIEKYGVSIKQSDVSARLAAQGLDGLTGSALKQAEQQARLELLFQQTSKSAGAFGKESGTLANQQQVLGAQVENLKAKIGAALLPVLTTLLTFVNTTVLPGLAKFGAFIAPVVERVKEMVSGFGGGTSALAPFAAFITGTVLPALASLGSYIAEKVAPVLATVADIVTTRVVPILATLGGFLLTQLLPAFAQVYAQIAEKLRPIFDQLAETFTTKVLPTVEKLLAKFQEAQPTLEKVALAVVKVAGKVLEFAAAIVGKVLPVVIQFAGFLLSNVVPVIATVVVTLVKVIGKVIDFGAALVTGVKAVIDFAAKVGEKIAAVLTFFVELPGKIKAKLGDLGQLLVGIGGQIVDGLRAGIDAAKQKVLDAVGRIVGAIPLKIRQLLGIASPSKVTTRLGRFVADGLAQGIEAGKSDVERALGSLTRLVASTNVSALTIGTDASAVGALTSGTASLALPPLEVVFTAEQVDQLTRGRQVRADLDAWDRTGGRQNA